MTNTAERAHFNLYYIFKEDKENNILDKKTAAEIWKTVCAKTITGQNGLYQPP